MESRHSSLLLIWAMNQAGPGYEWEAGETPALLCDW